MVCLDTNVIINLLRNDTSTVETITQLLENGARLTTTSINIFELWKGYYKSRRQDMLVSIEKIIKQLKVLPFDEIDAQKTAEIFQEFQRTGKTIDPFDLMIGVIALTYQESLFTLNKKHFERIEGLHLI